MLSAAVWTLGQSCSAVVVDFSRSGARLRCRSGIPVGQDLWIRVGQVDLLGTVVWSRGEYSGMRFDDPLAAEQVERLRREAGSTIVTRLTAEQRLAAEDWVSGFVR